MPPKAIGTKRAKNGRGSEYLSLFLILLLVSGKSSLETLKPNLKNQANTSSQSLLFIAFDMYSP